MNESIKLRILMNKRNKQLTVALSKKKISELKARTPKFIKLKDWEFMEE